MRHKGFTEVELELKAKELKDILTIPSKNSLQEKETDKEDIINKLASYFKSTFGVETVKGEDVPGMHDDECLDDGYKEYDEMIQLFVGPLTVNVWFLELLSCEGDLPEEIESLGLYRVETCSLLINDDDCGDTCGTFTSLEDLEEQLESLNETIRSNKTSMAYAVEKTKAAVDEVIKELNNSEMKGRLYSTSDFSYGEVSHCINFSDGETGKKYSDIVDVDVTPCCDGHLKISIGKNTNYAAAFRYECRYEEYTVYLCNEDDANEKTIEAVRGKLKQYLTESLTEINKRLNKQ